MVKKLVMMLAVIFRPRMWTPTQGPMFPLDEWEDLLLKQSLPWTKDRGYPLGVRSSYLWEGRGTCSRLYRHTAWQMARAAVRAWRRKRADGAAVAPGRF